MNRSISYGENNNTLKCIYRFILMCSRSSEQLLQLYLQLSRMPVPNTQLNEFIVLHQLQHQHSCHDSVNKRLQISGLAVMHRYRLQLYSQLHRQLHLSFIRCCILYRCDSSVQQQNRCMYSGINKQLYSQCIYASVAQLSQVIAEALTADVLGMLHCLCHCH